MSRISKAKARRLVADYMRSEGCGCCQDREAHERHRNALAIALDVPSHPDEPDFYDFKPFRTEGGGDDE